MKNKVWILSIALILSSVPALAQDSAKTGQTDVDCIGNNDNSVKPGGDTASSSTGGSAQAGDARGGGTQVPAPQKK